MLLLVFLSLIGFGVVIPLPFFATAFDAGPLAGDPAVRGLFRAASSWESSSGAGSRPRRPPAVVLPITIIGSALGYWRWRSHQASDRGAGAAAAGFFCNMSAIQGYIVDVSPPEKLAGRLGLIGSAFGVGFVVGPALGGLLAQPARAGLSAAATVAAGLCVLATIGILIFVRESRRTRGDRTGARNLLEALGQALRHPILAPAFGVIFFGFFASSALWSTLGLWLQARFGWGRARWAC